MIPQLVIDIVGWVYFVAWSLSFYGQLGLNFRLKNVEGMNFDFLAMNLTGFTFYSIYCSYGYFNPGAQEQTGKVDLNDLVFAYHAVFITILTSIQALVYPKGRNKIMIWTVLMLVAMWLFCMVYGTLSIGTKTFSPAPRLGVVAFMGYFKLAISFLKYLPQMYWNYKRKSTVGWSIMNILLDFTGGFFSFLQMALEALNGTHVSINPVKLVLAIMCMFYDLIFMFQHYCLYKNNNSSESSELSKPSLDSLHEPLNPPTATTPVQKTQEVSPQNQIPVTQNAQEPSAATV